MGCVYDIDIKVIDLHVIMQWCSGRWGYWENRVV